MQCKCILPFPKLKLTYIGFIICVNFEIWAFVVSGKRICLISHLFISTDATSDLSVTERAFLCKVPYSDDLKNWCSMTMHRCFSQHFRSLLKWLHCLAMSVSLKWARSSSHNGTSDYTWWSLWILNVLCPVSCMTYRRTIKGVVLFSCNH